MSHDRATAFQSGQQSNTLPKNTNKQNQKTKSPLQRHLLGAQRAQPESRRELPGGATQVMALGRCLREVPIVGRQSQT